MLKFYILTLGIYLICFVSNASENCSNLNSELKKAICFERDGEYKKATKLFKSVSYTHLRAHET